MSAGKLKRNTQESEVEEYLVEQVELHGGMCEKFNPPPKGRPDRIVTWPTYGFARVHFVELKTIGGKLESWQERDHARRRKLHCHVFVLWTKKQVDDYVARFTPKPRGLHWRGCQNPCNHWSAIQGCRRNGGCLMSRE